MFVECVQITVPPHAKMEKNTLCPPGAHLLVGSQTSAHKIDVQITILGIVWRVLGDMEVLGSDLPCGKDSLSSCGDCS